MSTQFFGTASDPNLSKHMLLQQPNMYISEVKYSGFGVVSKALDVVTLTPAVSPAWTVSDFVSAAGYNLVVKSGGKVFDAKVSANTAAAVSFDATEAVDTEDGTSPVDAADFTTSAVVEFYLMTAHSSLPWGDFAGYVKEMELNAVEEVASFTYGVPEKKIRQDVVKVEWGVKGKNFNILNPDIFSAIFNVRARGKNDATQWERHMGFSPLSRPFFRVSLLGKSVEDKDVLVQIFKGQFKLEGAVALSGNEHKGVGFMCDANTDALRPAWADAGRVMAAL